MRAFVVTGPRATDVIEVEPPEPRPGQVVVDVARAGICGTDVEFFTGEMAYLHQGHAAYPMRLGHEWCGTVSAVGNGVDGGWLGRRVTGDTALGCGHCARCANGLHWVCENRFEIGVRAGFPGALAEQLAVPATALHALPDSLGDEAGAMVEPGGNALRAVRAAALTEGQRVLVLGLGTIGLLAGMFAKADGAEVHVLGRSQRSIDFGRTFAFDGVWEADELPNLAWDSVIDASNAPDLPALALDLVEPGGRIVYIGLAGEPSHIDTRTLALKDVTAVGILGGSAGLAGAIDAFGSGNVDPRSLVAATVGLDRVGDVLGGWRPADAGSGPKILVNPSA
jgi:2-desacetyl-2-hydroxyethyl bacteriochlorophyllide A dehydrogenase